MYHKDEAAEKIKIQRREEREQEQAKAFYKEWENYRKTGTKGEDPMKPVQREADSTDNNRVDLYKMNNDLAVFKRPFTPPKPIIRIKPTPITVGTRTWVTTRVENSKPFTPSKTYIAPKYEFTPRPRKAVTPKPNTAAKYLALHSKVKRGALVSNPGPDTKKVALAARSYCYAKSAVPTTANNIGNKSIALPLKPNTGLKSEVLPGKPNFTVKSVVLPTHPNVTLRSVAFSLNSYPTTRCVGTIPPPTFVIKKPPENQIVGVSHMTSKTGRYDHATVYQTISTVDTDEKPSHELPDA